MGMREQIQPRREALGLKRRPLAEMAGVTYPTIANIETKPDKTVSIEIIAKVWRALDDYEAAGNRPVSMPVDEDDGRLDAVERRLSALEVAYGVPTPPVDPTLSRLEQVEARTATLAELLVRDLAPRESVVPPERQPSGSLDASIAAQRQRAAGTRRRPSK